MLHRFDPETLDAEKETVVDHEHRNRDHEAHHGCEQRLPDAGTERRGVRCLVHGDRLEDSHHAEHRAEKPEKRRNRRDELQPAHAVIHGSEVLMKEVRDLSPDIV